MPPRDFPDSEADQSAQTDTTMATALARAMTKRNEPPVAGRRNILRQAAAQPRPPGSVDEGRPIANGFAERGVEP